MVNSIKETCNDFLNFLKNPIDQPSEVQTKSHKLKRLLSLLAIDIPIMGVLLVVIGIFSKLGLINTENHQVPLLLEQFPVWLIIVLTVVILPFVEEIIFRLYLRFRRNYLARFVVLLSPNKLKTETSLNNLWNSNYRFVFYFSAIIFGVVHISNYELSSTTLYLIPILILPQIILGLFSGYLRVRYNLLLGYFMHALHNAFFISISLLSLGNPVKKLNVETDTYSLKIEEVAKQKTASSFFNNDSIHISGISLKSVIAILLEKDENLIESNNPHIVQKRMDLFFKINFQ